MIAAHECFVAYVNHLLVHHRLRFKAPEDGLHISRKLQSVSHTLVQATPGVGSVSFWSFTAAWTERGGGGLGHLYAGVPNQALFFEMFGAEGRHARHQASLATLSMPCAQA